MLGVLAIGAIIAYALYWVIFLLAVALLLGAWTQAVRMAAAVKGGLRARREAREGVEAIKMAEMGVAMAEGGQLAASAETV